MDDKYWNYVARGPRHAGRESEQVIVEIERLDGGMPAQLEARLLNISRGGMQVAAPVALLAGENVRIRLLDNHDASLHVEAVVRWVGLPSGEQGWHAGLRFAAELELDTLGEMFLARVLEE
jgi:hypothetical protein